MPSVVLRLRLCGLAQRLGRSMPRNKHQDIIITFEDTVAQMVLTQELPDVFGWVQLG